MPRLPDNTTRQTTWLAMVKAAATICVAVIMAASTLGQDTQQVRGDRLSGFVLPIEPLDGDIRLEALRANTWEVDDTQRLVLEQDVRIAIGSYRLSAEKAVVWINRVPSADGLINQIAIYFDDVIDSGGVAGLGVQGADVLLTGSARGEVILHVSSLVRRQPGGGSLVQRAERRLADYLGGLVAGNVNLRSYPQLEGPPAAEAVVPEPGGTLPRIIKRPAAEYTPPELQSDLPIFQPTGRVSIAAARLDIQSGEDENVLTAIGPLVVEYVDDTSGEMGRLTLTAERAVVFADPGPLEDLASFSFDAENVRGVYLEGNVVATDGEYTVRATRVYYDLRANRALLLDGVLRTYSRTINRPVYARADEIRQIARREWEADRATVSTSEFFTPHLSVGADRVVVSEAEDSTGTRSTRVRGDDATVRIGGMPVFWWPRIAGEPDRIPLRRTRAGYSDERGAYVETEWDGFALFGKEAPPGLDLNLHLDGYTDTAFGVGGVLEYREERTRGSLDLYAMYDNTENRTSAGRSVEPEDHLRGAALWEHASQLSDQLAFQAQFSYISDETFITSWRESDFEQRYEYETSVYLRHLDHHEAWTLLGSYHINNFLSNGWLLASRQYTVDKLPEFTYRRYGDSVFGDRLTYSTENRLTAMRMRFEEHSPDELGIRARGFGISRFTPFEEVLRGRGLSENWVGRADTRHEVALPLNAGDIRVVPFLVGRLTAYTDDFEEFSSDADEIRLFGAAGVRATTTIQRVYNDIESRALDLHRLRHLIEPSVMLWHGYSSVHQADLPVFDEGVESLADASAVRFAIDQTLQTQRGGPGRWRSVDWLTLDLALVLTTGEADREHPVPQFFVHRPEYSNLVDHWSARTMFQVSDSLALLGEVIYDLDASRLARGAIGAELRHTPRLNTFIEYRFVDASDTRLLSIAWSYQITSKYDVAIRPQYDVNEGEFRSLRVLVTRHFPDFNVRVGFIEDAIRGETRFSATIELAQF